MSITMNCLDKTKCKINIYSLHALGNPQKIYSYIYKLFSYYSF